MSFSLSPRPHEDLKRLAVVIEAGIPLPPDLSRWLLYALRSHMQTAEPLDRALGLARPGTRKAPFHLALDLRNRWIIEAALLLGLDHRLGNICPVSIDLRERILRAARGWRNRPLSPPCDLDEDWMQHPDQFYQRYGFERPIDPDAASEFVDTIAIPRVFHFGRRVDPANPVPTSQRQIRRILQVAA